MTGRGPGSAGGGVLLTVIMMVAERSGRISLTITVNKIKQAQAQVGQVFNLIVYPPNIREVPVKTDLEFDLF